MIVNDPPTDSLTIPSGAAPGDPQIVIGQAIPDELSAFYGAGITGAILYRFDAARYAYSAAVIYSGQRYRVDGMANTTRTPAVVEMFAYKLPDAGDPDPAARLYLGGLFGPGPATQVGDLTAGAVHATDSSDFETLTVQRLTVAQAFHLGGGAQSLWNEDSTALAGLVNTSPAVGSPVVGTAFVAPPSGAVFVTVGGNLAQSAVGNETILGWHMKTGNVLNAGTDVKTPDVEYAIRAGRAVVSGGGTATFAGSRRRPWIGLTPGATYNVVTKHWVTGGTGSLDQREVIVEPVFY